jgi:uncharacterized membrane-anchored protein
MKPLTTIYWLRVILGIVAGLVSAVLAFYQDATSLYTLVNSITAALAVYIISYYILKVKFSKVVEKPSKIALMGIGLYFFTWLAFFVLFYTILRTV